MLLKASNLLEKLQHVASSWTEVSLGTWCLFAEGFFRRRLMAMTEFECMIARLLLLLIAYWELLTTGDYDCLLKATCI